MQLPPGKKAIRSKWVIKVNLKSNGSLERFKTRLVVAKGSNKKYSIDFKETFSPIVKMTTIRCLLAIAASHKWNVHQLDVNNTFLHGDFNEEVYINMPDGISNLDNKFYLLKKSLYGLKQASRLWHSKLANELKGLRYVQSKNDNSLFFKKNNNVITLIVVYVDDILLTASTPHEMISKLKTHLNNVFTIEDLGG